MKENAHFGDFTNQSNGAAHVVAHSCAVHAGGNVSHIEDVVRGDDRFVMLSAESTRRDSIPSLLHVIAFGSCCRPSSPVRCAYVLEPHAYRNIAPLSG